MKNFIPLVLAVLLGLAAVLAVGRLLAERNKAKEKTQMVVSVARDIAVGDILTADSIMKKEVPVSARPAQAIFWSRMEQVVGQKALRAIAQGDYVLLSDVGLTRSMGDIVGVGEWAVTVPLNDARGIIQPGDEVAVIGTFKIKSKVKSADQSVATGEIMKEATMVLFPRVRVLDVGAMASSRSGEEGGGELVLALPPQQAQVLVAAARKAVLTIALRRPGDESAINRVDLGMVDDATFDNLLQGVDSIQMPKIPGVVTVSSLKEVKK